MLRVLMDVTVIAVIVLRNGKERVSLLWICRNILWSQ